jgi:DNA topoisomerase-1
MARSESYESDVTPSAAADLVESAHAAGLRHVDDRRPGLRRRPTGKKVRFGKRWVPDFVIEDAAGRRVRDPATLVRIRRLAIPPAWRSVWICTQAEGHLQATGRDARGRKQYRYHSRWRQERDATKYGRMLKFGRALPALRRRLEADLRRPGLPKPKVLATVVWLLQNTFIRVGNEEYARDNNSFGLTTLKDRHVDLRASEVRFHFRGKSGIFHQTSVRSPSIARIVRRCRDLPGQELFQYLGDDGQPATVDSADVNDYIRQATGERFTAKDFRTWAGTVSCAAALREALARTHTGPTNRQLMKAVEQVAAQLRNTPAVCRKSYIHPGVIASYLDGTLPAMFAACARRQSRRRRGLRTDEAAVLALLGPNRRQRAGGLTSSRP